MKFLLFSKNWSDSVKQDDHADFSILVGQVVFYLRLWIVNFNSKFKIIYQILLYLLALMRCMLICKAVLISRFAIALFKKVKS